MAIIGPNRESPSAGEIPGAPKKGKRIAGQEVTAEGAMPVAKKVRKLVAKIEQQSGASQQSSSQPIHAKPGQPKAIRAERTAATVSIIMTPKGSKTPPVNLPKAVYDAKTGGWSEAEPTISAEPTPRPVVPVRSPISKDKVPSALHTVAPSVSGAGDSAQVSGPDRVMVGLAERRAPPSTPLDPKFICSKEIYSSLLPKIQVQLLETEGTFDAAAFLRGPKGNSPEDLAKNTAILEKYIDFFTLQASNLSKAKGISLEDAYKLLIGALDTYDDEEKSQNARKEAPSIRMSIGTFALRTALLHAAGKNGVDGIQSWMVYTGGGKPAGGSIWPFLENLKNWVPEAQGAMEKFSEMMFISAKKLSKEHPENRILLLKGGFGAGKSRLAARLMGSTSSGFFSPDRAKQVVRRSMQSVTHASAHIEGSNIAFALFDAVIKDVTGTVVYDSSLSNPADIAQYLKKARAAGKKLVVCDVARADIARTLSILKREVAGEDPRIPPQFIVDSAIRDKLNRVDCMNIILNDKTTPGTEAEYHYYSADAKGFNTEQVMILTSNQGIKTPNPEMLSRLMLEGIDYDPGEKKFTMRLTREEVEGTFKREFSRSIISIVKELPLSEQADFIAPFDKRTLLRNVEETITDSASFYAALPERIKNALSEKVVVDAFNLIPPEDQAAFFTSLAGKEKVSYLDLPLVVALTIHQNLQNDPWI